MNTPGDDGPFLLQFDPPYSFLRSVFPMKEIQLSEAEEFSRLLREAKRIDWGEGKQKGCILWSESSFDSRILERKAAKVHRVLANDSDAQEELLRKLVEQLKSAGVSYASMRIPADYRLIQIAEDKGFRVVDGIHYLFITNSSMNWNRGGVIRPFKDSDAEKLLSISESAFAYGRFYHDPVVTNNQANNIYKTWIKNSFEKKTDDSVLVAEDKGEPAAFITLKKIPSNHISVGSVELLAVDGAARGKGLATALLASAAAYFQKEHVEAMIVDTQIHNQPGLNLYKKFGFRFGKTYITLRLAL